jgi:myo-inositol-1(or 4)-monophosphatase
MLEKEIRVASMAARTAGKILREKFGGVDLVRKKGVIDLVTEADLEAEKAVLDIIGDHFPQDHILSEEAGDQGGSSNRIWLIDPLDGTTNFMHGFPFFAVSIALEIDQKMVLGVVYNPYLEEYFEAVKGSGAFLNRRPIQVSKTDAIEDALLATGFPYHIHEHPEPVLERFARVLVKAQGVRRPGSAALDLCYVACGRMDGFWEEGLHPWDTAAGIVILSEAGGLLATYEGDRYNPYQDSIVAANPELMGVVLRTLNGDIP